MTLRWLKGSVGPVGQRLAVPARRAPPGSARRGHHGPLRRQRRGRHLHRRRRERAGRYWPSAWPGPGGGSWSSRPARSGTPTRTGYPTRPGPITCTGLRNGSSAAPTPSRWARTTPGGGSEGQWSTTPATAPAFTPLTCGPRPSTASGRTGRSSYEDIRAHYETVERELPVAGQDWPWGHPHRYPFSPHPVSEAASVLWRGAHRLGIKMRVGPVGIVNGTFGNRPHCIYRGYCLQGCKVNAKASPYVTHLPDALAHGVEIRANCMVAQVDIDQASGRATGVTYVREGETLERRQRAKVVAVAGYSIETPRLLLNSTSGRFAHGVGNDEDQVGRYVMVQGASQSAGRFPDELRMYKAPPPEVSSEDFYETDPGRGFARGFSIQTVSPLPIGWAEHVLADGHWGRALREYMRDYNHWSCIGVLNELLPEPGNRVTLAEEKDDLRPAGGPLRLQPGDNDKANIAYSTKVITDILQAAGAQDVLTIHRYAHLVGGARMGTSPDNSVVDANQRSGASPTCSSATAASAPPKAQPTRP